MSTPHFDTTIYSNSVSVGTTFLIGVCNWSLNILILWEKVTGCGWYQLTYFTWQKSGIHFGFILNWHTLLKTPQYVSRLLIRTVNFQIFLCIYSKSQTIQFHLFAINEVLCAVMRGTNCTFLLVYMKWSDGWNLQFMIFLWKLYLRLKEQALIYTCQNDWFNVI